MDFITIDLTNGPEPRFRIDSFNVPNTVRTEFDAAMARNLAFIRTLPGFRGHLVFERTTSSSACTVMTIAAWESAESIERAAGHVRAYYARIGFDPREACARWGVTAEIGEYRAVETLPESLAAGARRATAQEHPARATP